MIPGWSAFRLAYFPSWANFVHGSRRVTISQTETVIDCDRNFLLGAKVALCRMNR